jgi:hypothetical protein
MKKLFLPVILLILLYSCDTKHKRNDILTTGNLKSQFFYVNPERDTVLKTSHAAVLRIKKGTFNISGQVSIEIKEAYRPDEILLAGLTTTSDGKPLRSAGMIYFNATANGQSVEPSLPVATFIPSADKDTAMKIFKGEEQRDGNIDWVEPQAIDTAMPDAKRQLYEWGKLLYNGKCASCHRIFTNATGPALRNVQNRGPWKNRANLLAWLRNPARFFSTPGGQYINELRKTYNNSIMTGFSDIDMNTVQALLTYINNTPIETPYPDKDPSAKKDTVAVPVNNSGCGYDTTYITVKDDYAEYDSTGYPDLASAEDTAGISPPGEYEYPDYSRAGYDFNITTNGWYNIDAFLKTDQDKTVNVKLSAVVNQQQKFGMDVYLVVPTEKVMQPYSHVKDGQYVFDFDNGVIPLPPGYRALIFAVGSYKDKIYYGVTEFTVTKEQTIQVEIKETTKDGLRNLLYAKKMDGVEIEAIERKMQIQKRPCDGNRKTADTVKAAKPVALAMPL